MFAVYLETKRERGATLSDLMPDIQISLETESRENMGFLANGCDSASLAPKCFRDVSGLNEHFVFF